jgi:uncharacterized protein YlxW (UPF0749 family)
VKKRLSLSIVAIVCFLLLGFLIAVQMKDVNDNNRQTAFAQKDLTELQEQVMALIRENDALTKENEEITALIDSMGEELSGDNEALQAILDDKAKAEVFAGLTDVTGKGISLVITPTDTSVSAKTLLLLVNEFRASGALAIGINNERIAAMTEIRDTGDKNPQIVINGNSYPATEIYTVHAIYRQEDLNRGEKLISNLLQQFGTASDFSLSIEDSITIPKLPEDSIIN